MFMCNFALMWKRLSNACIIYNSSERQKSISYSVVSEGDALSNYYFTKQLCIHVKIYLFSLIFCQTSPSPDQGSLYICWIVQNFCLCKYRNDSIQRPGCLFTFGTSREGAYLRQGTYFFFINNGTITETVTVTNTR